MSRVLGKGNLWLYPTRASALGRPPDTWGPIRRTGFVSRRPRRCFSSEPPTIPVSPPEPPTPPPTPAEDEKPKERSKRIYIRRTETRETLTELPSDLAKQVLWSPADSPSVSPEQLPPEDILSEAWSNLLVCFNPQIQLRSLYSVDSEPVVEPTLALYCPLEGANHRIDAVLQEFAHRLDAEILTLDSIQLAAGQWGSFGKANSLDLPYNPLHFDSGAWVSAEDGEEDNEYDDSMVDEQEYGPPRSMTIHVSGVVPMRAARPNPASPVQSTPNVRRRAFFDKLLNLSRLPAPPILAGDGTGAAPETTTRPRIVYVRDYLPLAPSRQTWLPSLISAVRSRRQGALGRQSSPVANPTVIIFGITAPLIGTSSRSTENKVEIRRGTGQKNGGPALWSEDDASNAAREDRLRERLRHWENWPQNLEIPDEHPLHQHAPVGEMHQSPDNPPLLAIPYQGIVGNILEGIAAVQRRRGDESPDGKSPYFRTSLILPKSLDDSLDKLARIARRREMNILAMQMAVGSIGGFLGELPVIDEGVEGLTSMIRHWDLHLEDWSFIKETSDRAVGLAMSAGGRGIHRALEPVVVQWSDISASWAYRRSSRTSWQSWIRELVGRPSATQKQTSEQHVEDVDDALRQLKHSRLTDHERRLLNCFVTSSMLETTFSQVHLPNRTIDAVRSIISLPLLHPEPFSQGILKSHSMTGILLFGPPGTGKTLLARALAKESGARMMLVKPSDVMDMYVGEGEKLVKTVFSLARRMKPCIIFLDEIDALLGSRVAVRDNGGAFAQRGVITEFMQEMDGLMSSQDGSVVVVGATNRPFDLDDAILRRLPRRILVDMPGAKEREAILRILLESETLSSDLNLSSLSQRTEGFSGSDLKHLCVSAALDAVKEAVAVPWQVEQHQAEMTAPDAAIESPVDATPSTENDGRPRVLSGRHFIRALQEISPSASESLGSLSELRKWNDKFGEGARERAKKLWGGRFGFI